MDTILKSVFYVLLTLVTYFLMLRIYQRYHYPLLIPAVTSTVILACFLLNFNIPYDQYMYGGEWINLLLGPGVVALAYPLYKQRHLLRKYWIIIISSTLCGLFFSMLSGTILAILLNLPSSYILSMLPRSITTPVAIQISSDLGGDPSLTSVYVMVAGFTGAMLAPMIFKMFKLNTDMGRGVGLGTSSHAMGTAVAVEYGEEVTSISSVSMTVSAVLGSFVSPIVVWFL